MATQYRYQSPEAPYDWSQWFAVTDEEPGQFEGIISAINSASENKEAGLISVSITPPAGGWKTVEFQVNNPAA